MGADQDTREAVHTSYARAFLVSVSSVAPHLQRHDIMTSHRHSPSSSMHQRARHCSTATRGTSHVDAHAWQLACIGSSSQRSAPPPS